MHENCQEGEGRIKEACGVFGIYDPDGEDVAGTITMGSPPCSTGDRNPAGLQYAIPKDPREI